MPGQTIQVGSQVVGVSLARCTHLAQKTLTEVKKWHHKVTFPCDCLSIAPRCIGVGQEHPVIRHPEQWSHILPRDQVSVMCQNARNTVLPDGGARDDVLHNFIESVCVHFPPDPLKLPPVSHDTLLQQWGQDKLQALLGSLP